MSKRPETIDELYPSRWLRPDDLQGRSVEIEVMRVTVEEIYTPQTYTDDWRAILDFGRSKRMILNKTQCEAMRRITGSEKFTDWAGANIALDPGIAHNGKPTIVINEALAAPPIYEEE